MCRSPVFSFVRTCKGWFRPGETGKIQRLPAPRKRGGRRYVGKAAIMSLYYVEKLIYQLNRDPAVRKRFLDDMDSVLDDYDLSEEELAAIRDPDIGLLYVLGVNGQLLMHYAALRKYEWNDYIQAMKDGLEEHGPVRAGLYARTGGGAV